MAKPKHDWPILFGRPAKGFFSYASVDRRLAEALARPVHFDVEGQAYRELMARFPEEKGDWGNDE